MTETRRRTLFDHKENSFIFSYIMLDMASNTCTMTKDEILTREIWSFSPRYLLFGMEKVSSVDLNHHFLHDKQVLYFSGLTLIPIEVADCPDYNSC